MSTDTSPTIDFFQVTDQGGGQYSYDATWNGGNPNFNYEIRRQGEVTALDSGTSTNRSASGTFVDNQGGTSYTFEVTDTDGDSDTSNAFPQSN